MACLTIPEGVSRADALSKLTVPNTATSARSVRNASHTIEVAALGTMFSLGLALAIYPLHAFRTATLQNHAAFAIPVIT